MQKIFKLCITISLIHHCRSFVAPPSPDLQILLPDCSLLRKIKVRISFVCCNCATVFTCSIRIYLHCGSERFPQIIHEITGTDFKPPYHSSFICKIFNETFMLMLLKQLKRHLKTPKNTYKMHYDFLQKFQENILQRTEIGCLVCPSPVSDK